MEHKTLIQACKESAKELVDTGKAFMKAPRALWGINIPYIVEGLVYFGVLTILGKYCSENVALSDLHAGWVYGGVTGGITFAMLILGGWSDKIGVRNSLILSFAMLTVGRILVAFSGSGPFGQGASSPMFFMMSAGLFFVVLAYGLYQPASYAGVKRYTNPQTAAMAYAVIYGLMNLGAFFSGFVSPFTRGQFERVFPPNGLTAVFWVYAALTLGALLITILVVTKKADREAAMAAAEVRSNEGAASVPAPATLPPRNNRLYVSLMAMAMALAFLVFAAVRLPAISSTIKWLPITVSGLWVVFEFLRERPDHPLRDARFVFFIFALVPVQTLFAHNWLTIPYYLDRAFQGTVVSQYFEFFSNLNPILVFILAPIIAGLTAKTNIYRMMIAGTFVMALPCFLLAIGPNMYLFLAYVFLSTLGESMWQPRFLQWISEIAPEGKVGAYQGIGQFPWFLTKMITSAYSGWFVAHYIPKPEDRLPLQTEKMWLIYSLIAVLSPLILLAFKKWMMTGTKHAAFSADKKESQGKVLVQESA